MARVIVNRIWQAHFGEGLVTSANDFGVMGDGPSHPDLLDWLASEFDGFGLAAQAIASDDRPLTDLSVIVGLRAPRRQSRRQGTLIWRWRPRRLEAEVVRDSILAVSGQLNPRMGGPGVYPTFPRSVLEGQSRPGEGWGKSDDREQSRRSIYIFVKRAWACPSSSSWTLPTTRVVASGGWSRQPARRLSRFLNGAFIHEQSRHFASRLIAEVGQARRAIRWSEHLSWPWAGRRGPKSHAAALEFLEKQERQIQADAGTRNRHGRARTTDARQKALEAFCLVIMNMNEFVYNN